MIAALNLDLTACSPKLSSIALTPNPASVLIVGSTQLFTATGTHSDGTTADITSQVIWTSDNTGTATISTTGLAAGVAPGIAKITAVMGSLSSLPVALTVISLSSITITPASLTNFTVGSTRQFKAIGTYTDNSTAEITSQVTWASSDTTVATISSVGLATSVAEGSNNITADLSGINSPTITLNTISLDSSVQEYLDAGCTILWSSTVIPKPLLETYSTGGDEEDAITVYLKDVGTSNVDVNVISGMPTEGSTVRVSSGVVELNPGDCKPITATMIFYSTLTTPPPSNIYFNITRTSVSQSPSLSSIEVTPPPDSLSVGSMFFLTATGIYSDGSTSDVTLLANWSNSNPTVADLYSDGLGMGESPGADNITASISGINSAPTTLNIVSK